MYVYTAQHSHTPVMHHASTKKVPFAITDLTSPKRKLKPRDPSCCPRAPSYAMMEPELSQAGSLAPRPGRTISVPH